MTLFAGVSGGGTRTECVIIDDGEREVARGNGGPTNTNFVSLEEAAANAREAIGAAFANVERCAATGVALAGSLTSQHEGHSYAIEELERRCDRVIVFGEHQAALASCGLYEDFGVAVVSGTGSSVVAFRDGKQQVAGGFGSFLGDQGSAHEIATNALRVAFRSMDGSGPKSAALEAAVLAHFDLHVLMDMIPLLHREGVRRERIADFCRELSPLQDTDPVIGSLFEHAGSELAATAGAAARGLFAPGDPFPVAESGGTWTADGRFRQMFEARFSTEYPLAEYKREAASPAMGLAVRSKRELE